jgi:deoxyhypusine synthase
VDWIVSTGAILYHDMHFALNYPVASGDFRMDDTELRDNDIVRVYDVLLGYSDCLMATDEICAASSPSRNSRKRWAQANCIT